MKNNEEVEFDRIDEETVAVNGEHYLRVPKDEEGFKRMLNVVYGYGYMYYSEIVELIDTFDPEKIAIGFQNKDGGKQIVIVIPKKVARNMGNALLDEVK